MRDGGEGDVRGGGEPGGLVNLGKWHRNSICA
jgi:hypothetical protein